ncbi:MAG: hypothetical protein AB7N99_02530 [Simkaniaceae bacterium]
MANFIRLLDIPYTFLLKHSISATFILISIFFTITKLYAIDIWKGLYSFTEAILCSYLFYFIVVFIPQKRRTKHIKKIVLIAYDDFKEEIISHLVQMSDQHIDNIKNLFEPSVFRQHFPKEKWYQVANSLYDNQKFAHTWRLKSQFLRNKIIFLLNAVEHNDSQSFSSLKIFCWNLQELESINLTYDYESQKQLMQFFWQIFAGWNFIKGYLKYDYIKTTICKL